MHDLMSKYESFYFILSGIWIIHVTELTVISFDFFVTVNFLVEML